MQQPIVVTDAAVVRSDDVGQRLTMALRQLRRMQPNLVGVELQLG